MRLLATLLVAAATLSAAGCGKDKDKAADQNQRPARPADRGPSAPRTATLTPPAAPAPPPPVRPTVTVAEAATKLSGALAPVVDGIEGAAMHGCAEGANRVAALFDQADEGADALHELMRDDALRAQLQASIRDRTDPAVAKALAKIDTTLLTCKPALDEVKKGLDLLTSPAIPLAPPP